MLIFFNIYQKKMEVEQFGSFHVAHDEKHRKKSLYLPKKKTKKKNLKKIVFTKSNRNLYKLSLHVPKKPSNN